jgi:hypothetical protein
MMHRPDSIMMGQNWAMVMEYQFMLMIHRPIGMRQKNWAMVIDLFV